METEESLVKTSIFGSFSILRAVSTLILPLVRMLELGVEPLDLSCLCVYCLGDVPDENRGMCSSSNPKNCSKRSDAFNKGGVLNSEMDLLDGLDLADLYFSGIRISRLALLSFRLVCIGLIRQT